MSMNVSNARKMAYTVLTSMFHMCCLLYNLVHLSYLSNSKIYFSDFYPMLTENIYTLSLLVKWSSHFRNSCFNHNYFHSHKEKRLRRNSLLVMLMRVLISPLPNTEARCLFTSLLLECDIFCLFLSPVS